MNVETHIGQYKIVRTLGAGGMGTVYEAEQDKPLRMVALKVIRAELATPALLLAGISLVSMALLPIAAAACLRINLR